MSEWGEHRSGGCGPGAIGVAIGMARRAGQRPPGKLSWLRLWLAWGTSGVRESVVIDLIPVNVKDLRSRRSLICHLDARRSRGPRAHRSVRWALVYTGYAAGTEL